MMKNIFSKKLVLGALCALVLVLLSIAIFIQLDSRKIGTEIDSYQNVKVYYNGILYAKSHGKNYADNGYYFGQKWQCVEFIKRFYFQVKGHEMPDVLGNAKNFFSYDIQQGELNPKRDMLQYYNGGDVPPKVDDLLVFADSRYGHVGIVTKVTDSELEIIQQNVLGKPRETYTLTLKDGKWTVSGRKTPAGWLRIQ